MDKEKAVKGAKERVSAIRIRTWTLTLVILVAVVFYFLMVFTFKSFDPILFVLLVVLQVVAYCIYFPDGELFGQRNLVFIANRKAYNLKATKINQERKSKELREYCEFEYQQRKQRYILNECGAIGIELEELDILRQKSEKEIKKIEFFENNGRIIHFTKERRKRLFRLIYKDLPVEKNEPETILSALKNNTNEAIEDDSIAYKRNSYIVKVLWAVLVGGFFAYIGYTFRNGIGLEQIFSVIMCFSTIFTTSVFAFSGGETCQKVYKSRFYLALSNFIDSFFEWAKIPYSEQIEENKEEEGK